MMEGRQPEWRQYVEFLDIPIRQNIYFLNMQCLIFCDFMTTAGKHFFVAIHNYSIKRLEVF